MEDKYAQRFIMALVLLAVALMIGWEPIREASLPDEHLLSAGRGIARWTPPETVAANRHPLRRVTHASLDDTLSNPDLKAETWQSGAGGFADSSEFGPAAGVDDDAPAVANRGKREKREGLGGEKKETEKGMFKERERSQDPGWLRDAVRGAEAEAAEDGGGDEDWGEAEGDRWDFDDTARTGMGMDDMAPAESMSESAYEDYLFERMGAGDTSVGFDSMDGFGDYAPDSSER